MKTKNILVLLLSIFIARFATAAIQQAAIWDFFDASVVNPPTHYSEVVEPGYLLPSQPMLVLGGGVKDVDGKNGAGGGSDQAAAWDDIHLVPDADAYWTVTMDTRGWRTVSVRFAYKGFAEAKNLDIDYRLAGGSWVQAANNIALSTVDWTTYDSTTLFGNALDDQGFVELRFYNLDQTGANDKFAFDNFAIWAERIPVPATPPAAPTVAVANDPKVTVSWAAVAGATSYNVYRRTGTTGSFVLVGTTNTTTYVDYSVADNTSYYFRFSAVNSGGEGGQSPISAVATTKLAPPGNVVATRTAATTAHLTWSAVTGATSYRLHRSSTIGGPYTQLSYAPTGTSQNDTTVSSGQAYFYRITAQASAGANVSRYSLEAGCSATIGGLQAKPTVPAAVAANNPQVTVSWTAASGATSYNVRRSTTRGGPYTGSPVGTVAASPFVDTTAGMADNTTFFYVVSAVGSAGESGETAEVSATTPPAPPTGINVTVASGQAVLTWSAATGATSYKVRRSATQGGPYADIGTATITSYTNAGLTDGTTYYYVIASLKGGPDGRNSSEVIAVPGFLVINEAKINPPNGDAPYEYVELRGTPGMNLANYHLVVVDGTSTTDTPPGNPGVAKLAVDLGTRVGTLPVSGLVQISGNLGHKGLAFSTAQVIEAALDGTDVIPNDSASIFLIRVPQGVAGPASGNDYDTQNSGGLNVAPFGTVGTVIVDAIGWARDSSPSGDQLYSSVRLNQTTGRPDAATRFPGNNVANSLAAWYFGDLDDNSGNSQALGYTTDPSMRSANFPAGAANSIFLTPGAPNEPNNISTIGVIGPQSFAAWVYYYGQQNAPITFSLNGVTSLSWDISDMDALNNDTDNLSNYAPQVNGASGTFAVSPSKPCFNIMVTFIPDGDWTRARSFPIAGVIGGANSIFHGGVSDGSTAVPIAGNLMLFGDDETNPIRIYDRTTNGVILNAFDPSQWLSLLPPPVGQEVDIEAAATVVEGTTKVTYWIGSHANGPADDGFAARPNRNRFFATTLNVDSGDPATTQLSFGDTINNNRAYNPNFRTAFQAWHPELRLADSMLAGKDSKTAYGFNIEGLGLSYDGNTMYVGFRAPLVPAPAVGLPIEDPSRGTMALLAPLTGFRGLITGALGAQNGTLPVFGDPIQVDLGGRGVRAMRRGSVSGADWIVAGLPTASQAPGAFALYLWTGGSTALEYMVDLAGKNPEAIVEDFGTGIGGFYGQIGNKIRLIEDSGTLDWYNTGVEPKRFPIDSWGRYRRTRSDVITVGPWANTPAFFYLVPNSISAGASEGFGITDSDGGGVVGQSDGPSGPQNQYAFFSVAPLPWNPGASAGALQSLSANPQDKALAVYANSKAVGYSTDSLGNRRAVMWDLASWEIAQTIPTLGGSWNEARGIGINNNVLFWGLHVVGASQKAAGVGAFLWNEYNSSYVWDLPGVAGSTYTVANAINNYAQAVGGSGTSSANLTACLWEERDSWGLQHAVPAPVVLGTFPNLGGSSEALAINDNGTVVGYAFTNGVKHACLWARTTSFYQIYDLGTHNVAANSEARGIGVSGQVVGWEDFGGGVTHGITWINGRWNDLNTRVPTSGIIATANAVNGFGDITGGWKANAQSVPQAYYIWSSNDDD